MTPRRDPAANVLALDDTTRDLVRLAALAAVGTDAQIRATLIDVAPRVPPVWIEELLLQTYLFAGFPRGLNAMREWRRVSGRTPVPEGGEREVGQDDVSAFRARGEATCARVYGRTYHRLRHNIRQLHPALDDWMIVEGYGKVLSRPGLDLERRELCIVAACAAAGQSRQLHSHLRGALNVGARPELVDGVLAALEGVVRRARLTAALMLWARVRGK